MKKPTMFAATISIGLMTLSLQVIDPGLTLAADQQPKAKPQSKTVKPKIAKPKTDPKFHTAETAAKGTACSGVGPQIETLVPDEGKPGVKVRIKGVEFGSPGCLRGVSFGPGRASTFTMENESIIIATVPTGGRKGLVIVTVTTASGVDSKPFLVK